MHDNGIGRVLLLGGDKEAIDVLVTVLFGSCKVFVEMDSQLAVAAVLRHLPHLVLVLDSSSDEDVSVVLQSLRHHVATRDIPTFVVGSPASTLNAELALLMGAGEYIPWPLDPCLLRASVRRHVNLSQSRFDTVAGIEMIREFCDTLQEFEEQRDEMTHMLVHDLRESLSSVISGLNSCLMQLDDPTNNMCEVAGILEKTSTSANRLRVIFNAVLDLRGFEPKNLPLRRMSARSAALYDPHCSQSGT